MKEKEVIVDCHYCEHSACVNATSWCRCYADYGYYSHEVKDSKKEAEECECFEYCDFFPRY